MSVKEKQVTTKVRFTNEEVKEILLREAGAPAEVDYADLRDGDGDSTYLDFEILWTEVVK